MDGSTRCASVVVPTPEKKTGRLGPELSRGPREVVRLWERDAVDVDGQDAYLVRRTSIPQIALASPRLRPRGSLVGVRPMSTGRTPRGVGCSDAGDAGWSTWFAGDNDVCQHPSTSLPFDACVTGTIPSRDAGAFLEGSALQTPRSIE